ncbi:MAG: pentapeptide repeat-containing protein [Actinomycetota bacterium]|nr:pentapeptide repeat-containing protein [Actinomycetota bacterium]
MSPEVTAAIIAASVSFLTLIGTLAAQYFGHRATSRDTQKSFAEQHEQLDRTLAEQRTRTLNERFATAAGQLGDDKPPTVRLAGVYAMADLADDWPENRQTCVEVLCGYLRMPYGPDPGQDAPEPERLSFRASREVRHTVIRVLTAHLKDDAAVSWQGLNFDFTGAVFDGGDFSDAVFSGGTVDFSDAVFSGGTVDFSHARFSGGTVYFSHARFSGGRVDFSHARFSGGTVYFSHAVFSGGRVDFFRAVFSGGRVAFAASGSFGFPAPSAVFSGGQVDFSHARFSGGTVDFRNPRDWSFPPAFPWTDTPPPGVMLPKKKAAG